MNRTTLFLAAAACLAAVALISGLPRGGAQSPSAPAPAPAALLTPPPVAPPPTTPTSEGSLSLSARLSHPFIPAGRADLFVTADIRGAEVPGQNRLPVNLCLVIDRSGSMSGFKLEQAKQAARQLVSQLSAADQLAIVHFGTDVQSMNGVLATDENKPRLLRYIDGIWDNGGTNIGQALKVGRAQLERSRNAFQVNRLVLVSDGQPTEGLVQFGGLVQLVRDGRAAGLSVSSIGVGNDFNEQLMEAFAEKGGGAYAYLQDASQLASIFQKDLNAAGTQVARGVTLTFRAPRGATFQEVLGYSTLSRRVDGDSELITIALPDFASGQLERVVARFTVEGGAPNTSFDVSALGLDYYDLLRARGSRSDARLSAMVSDSADVVAKGRDKDAVVFAARAQSAVNTQAAAEALKQGDHGRAESLLFANEAVFSEAASVAGTDSVKMDLDVQRTLQHEMKSANSADDVNAYNKKARKQARQDFGLMGSTY